MNETNPCGNCCQCFESPANKMLMEAAVARYSDRSSYANNQAQDTATLLNANFQAVATNTLNTTSGEAFATLVSLLQTASGTNP